MIADAHLHVWAANATPFPFDPTVSNPPSYAAPAELLLEYMDEAGVEKAVIVQVRHYGEDHGYMLDTMKRWPGRFGGVCYLRPWDRKSPDRFAELVEKHGVRGIRLRPASDPGSWWEDDTSWPLLERAAGLGAVVTLLTNPVHLPRIYEVAKRFAGAVIVVDHFAHVDPREPKDVENLLRLAELPNIYHKVTEFYWTRSFDQWPFRASRDLVRQMRDAYGAQRLLWGSNFPLVLFNCGYTRCLKLVTEQFAFLTARDREWILGKTAAKLFL